MVDAVYYQFEAFGYSFSFYFVGQSLVEMRSTVNLIGHYPECFDGFHVEEGIEPVGEVEGPVDVTVSTTVAASAGEDGGGTGIG